MLHITTVVINSHSEKLIDLGFDTQQHRFLRLLIWIVRNI